MSDEEREHRRLDRPGQSIALDGVPEGCIGFDEAFMQYRELRWLVGDFPPKPNLDDHNSKKWNKWQSARLDQFVTAANEFMKAAADREFRPLVADPKFGRILQVPPDLFPYDLWEEWTSSEAGLGLHNMFGGSSCYTEWNGLVVFIRQERFEAWLANQKPPASAATGERPSEPDEREQEVEATLSEDISPPGLTGMPGRPSSKHLIEVEFGRRITGGEIEDTLSGEALALAKWLKKKHPDHPQAQPVSIANNIRTRYRQAKVALDKDQARTPEATP